MFDGASLVVSGTFEPDGKNVSQRLASLFHGYRELTVHYAPDEMVFERMNRVVNIMVPWSCGVIVAAFSAGTFGNGVTSDNGSNYQVSPPSWKKFDRENHVYNAIRANAASDDETVAVMIGMTYLQQLEKGTNK